MSRFTSPPFHKPAPFLFPSLPLSPPETSTDVGTVVPGTMNNPLDSGRPAGGLAASTPPDLPAARPRKVSSIHYHSSPLRDSRERTPHRSHKSLVIVIPPNSLIQQHGQLGHTLSTGPQHRLSQGVMMPLLPTMYAQLTAIAREFNFPSIVGLCLYLQLAEGGVTTTPRIPDDSWQLLWSHIFESSPASPTIGPFIAGRLEFDIDIQHARWYSSWISSLHRDQVDSLPSGFPFTAPVGTHVRDSSHPSLRDDDYISDNTYQSRFGHTTRHVPRKLSLAERFDTRGDSRAPSRQASSPQDQLPAGPQGLSPIFQEEEPKSARHELDKKILSWRSSAISKPTPLSKMGQLSLEPANMPNDLPTLGNESAIGDDFNLDDFDWSVTSLGPQDYDPISPIAWGRPDSVHLADRLQGSVCLTPSICTSFGPPDILSPLASSISRLPSPDIAHRMYDDCPLTPDTCTTWGPLSSISVVESCSCISSIDIANRMIFSRPVSPLTATSWGPSDRSWPSSESCIEYEPSIHLADRGLLSPVSPTSNFLSSHSSSLYSEYNKSMPEHFHDFDYSNGISLQQPMLACETTAVESTNIVWQHSWPYSRTLNPSGHETLRYTEETRLFSEHDQSIPVSAGETVTVQSKGAVWQHSWPYSWSLNRNFMNISSSENRSAIVTSVPSSYPRLNIYPEVYPHLVIYPTISGHETLGYAEETRLYSDHDQSMPVSAGESVIVQSKVAVWQHSWPYSWSSNRNFVNISSSENQPAIVTSIPSSYPRLNIYPTVYPHLVIYPAISGHGTLEYADETRLYFEHDQSMTMSADETDAVLSISTIWQHSWPYNRTSSRNILEVSSSQNWPVVVTSVPSSYPRLNIYPTVYPHLVIYPTVTEFAYDQDPSFPKDDISSINSTKCLASANMCSNRQSGRSSAPEEGRSKLLAQTLPGGYPMFNIYPAVYPHFDLYPSAAEVYGSQHSVLSQSRLPTWNYPFFSIYRAVYPHFDLYPNHILIEDEHGKRGSMTEYPHLNIYPLSYSHFNASPTFTSVEDELRDQLCVSAGKYPYLNIYPASYPFFDLYPKAAAEIDHPKSGHMSTSLISGILATNSGESMVSSTLQSPRPKKSSRLTHSELHAMVMIERLSNDFKKPTQQLLRQYPSQHDHHSVSLSRNNTFSFTKSRSDIGPALTSPISTLSTIPRRSQSLKMRAPTDPSIYEQDLFEIITPPNFNETNSSRPTSTSTSKRNHELNLDEGNHNDHRQATHSIHISRQSNSIVNRRVKAFDSVADKALGETLNKFPMPPASTKPKSLDRTKYPFL
ncbi:hypothetical protein BDQ17DRAFT_1349409 [Cyathus striatus]|nr:hypothetical protein BDQ17DRAFT_1349409 [Cyathus striatus]